jgi:putative Flp pilus-assembly TadE/G-like protein
MKLKIRARDEKGAVLVIVAIVMTALLTLSAGGILVFTLYGANREMQKAADQAALAGAAALPLLRPGVALESLNMNPVYRLTNNVGLDVPLKSLVSGVPDPRAVACAYGHYNMGGPQGDKTALEGPNARLIKIYGSAADPFAGGTYCSNAPWSDGRVLPTVNGLATPLTGCINSLTSSLTSLISQLQGALSLPLLGGILGNINATINQVTGVLNAVKNLEALSPALLTPEMTVQIRSGVNPPMMSFITGSNGIQMTVEATAARRLKNAVVLPNTPGLTGVSLNTALAATKPTIMNALNGPGAASLNNQLNTLMSGLGLSGCQNLLSSSSKLVQDIDDIYNPPAGGPAPTARDLIAGATTAAQQSAAGAGQNVNDLAGEAVLLIRQGPNPSSLSSLLGPVFSLLGPVLGVPLTTQIPAMDVVAVAAHNLEDGNISNPDLISDLAAARGLFTATLVK